MPGLWRNSDTVPSVEPPSTTRCSVGTAPARQTLSRAAPIRSTRLRTGVMIEIRGLVMLRRRIDQANPDRRPSLSVRSAKEIERLADRHNKAATGLDNPLLVRYRNGFLLGWIRAPWQRRPYFRQTACESIWIPGLERPGALHSRSLLPVYREIRQQHWRSHGLCILDDGAPALEQRGLHHQCRVAEDFDLVGTRQHPESAHLVAYAELDCQRHQLVEIAWSANIALQPGTH